MSNFQLFPPPSPKPKVSKNPFRRELKRPSDPQPTSPIPLEDLKNKDTTEAVLLQIIEDTNNIKMPPKARRPKTSVSAPKSNWEPRSTVSSSKSGPQNDKSGQRDLSKGDESASGSNVAPQHSASPEIPMRSICPRYNPNVPLGEQGYYPETGHASRHKPRDLKLSPPPEIDRALGPKTVPASVVDFPLDISDATEIHYASATELQGLWEAANGQKTQDLSGMFNLRIARTESATFVFGDPRAPFYTMQTYSTDEMSISRTNPSNTKSNVPIMMLRLEDRCRREPPNDGLVSLLFSRLAAMLAIEQAEELARQHQLSPGEAAEVEGNALRRAAAQESCRLTWNRTKKLYELHHPWLEKQQPPALVGAMGIPLSPIRSKYSGALHISVSTPSKDSRQRQPPTILVTTPIPANPVDTNMAATPRTSTLPLTDTDDPLASLDLGTMTMSISASAIVTMIPSLYAIDSLVSAMLAVAVSDELTNPVLADMKLYDPRPQSFPRDAPFNGNLVTTLAEREEIEESNQLMMKVKAQPSQRGRRQRSRLRFWDRSTPKTKAKNKNKKIVIEEFDLEKYGRYGQSSSREGQKLPSVTRGCLRVIFWGLNLVVRGLTLVVKLIAWFLVNITLCVTSEKF